MTITATVNTDAVDVAREVDVDILIERLEALDLSLGSWKDIENTERHQEIYWQKKREIALLVDGLKNVSHNLDKPQSLLADCEARREATLAKRAEIQQEIASAIDLAALPASTAAERDLREREATRQQELSLRLDLLDAGRLYAAPGVTYETVASLDHRIAELKSRIALVRSRFDQQVAAAEALLATPSSQKAKT